MGHPQPQSPIHCDNSTAVGIANNMVKWQRSRSTEMRFFWVADAVKQEKFDIKYYPRKENLGNYLSKHHIGSHHTAVGLGTYTNPHQFVNYHALVSLALRKGVLEPYQMGRSNLNPFCCLTVFSSPILGLG